MKFMYSCAIALSVLCGATAAHAVALTDKICAKKFDDCKSDVKNIFNQGKCKKERKKCEVQVDRAEARQNDTKNRMMNGIHSNSNSNDMRQQVSDREAARQRLIERQNAFAGQPAAAPGQSMRDKLRAQNQAEEEQNLDPKEAARRRLQERSGEQNPQDAQTPVQQPSMRDRMKKQN